MDDSNDAPRRKGPRPGEIRRRVPIGTKMHKVTFHLTDWEFESWVLYGEGPVLRAVLTDQYLDRLLAATHTPEALHAAKNRYFDLLEEGWSHEKALWKVTNT